MVYDYRDFFYRLVMSKKNINRIVLFSVCPIMGVLANYIPTIINNPDYRFGVPGLAEEFADGNSILAYSLLIISGLIAAYLSNVKSCKIGLAIVILMPIIAIAEATVNPCSHNLLPIELVFTYPFMALIAGGAALLGKLLKSKIKKEAKEIGNIFWT